MMKRSSTYGIANETHTEAERLLDIARDLDQLSSQIDDQALRHNIKDRIKDLIHLASELSSISSRISSKKF